MNISIKLINFQGTGKTLYSAKFQKVLNHKPHKLIVCQEPHLTSWKRVKCNDHKEISNKSAAFKLEQKCKI